MKRLILVFCAILLVLVGCTKKTESEKNETSETEEVQDADNTENSEITENTEEESKFCDDKIIDAFIKQLNTLVDDPIVSVESTSRKYRATTEYQGYFIEFSDLSGTLEIHINETNDTADLGVGGMRDVFSGIVKTYDSMLGDDEINAMFDELVSSEYMKETKINDIDITVWPDKELSNGHNRGHIDLSCKFES